MSDPVAWPPVPTPGRLLALVGDLMDRSRITGARPDVTFLGGQATWADIGPDDVVLVDLGRPAALDAVAAMAGHAGHIIGFVSHVDEERAQQAAQAGVHEVLPRSLFFRRLHPG